MTKSSALAAVAPPAAIVKMNTTGALKTALAMPLNTSAPDVNSTARAQLLAEQRRVCGNQKSYERLCALRCRCAQRLVKNTKIAVCAAYAPARDR